MTILACASILAQDNKGEFFVGYSHGQVDGSTGRFVQTTDDIRDTGALKFHGFEASGVYNVSRYVGLKADVSATFHGGDFRFSAIPPAAFVGEARNSLYNVLGGVQFKDNSSKRRIKPFAHMLGGIGHARASLDARCEPAGGLCAGVILPDSGSETGFAGAFGGGVDLRLNDRFDLRLFQVDYNPVKLDSGTLHNARISIGVVIK